VKFTYSTKAADALELDKLLDEHWVRVGAEPLVLPRGKLAVLETVLLKPVTDLETKPVKTLPTV
jgi:hypothetical protein